MMDMQFGVNLQNLCKDLKYCLRPQAKRQRVVAGTTQDLRISQQTKKKQNCNKKRRMALRAALQKEIAPHINEFVEKAEFPSQLLPKIRQLNLFQQVLNPPYGKPFSTAGQGMIYAELARIDAGLASFIVVQGGLVLATIEMLGSEDQKKKYIPIVKNIQTLAGWGLTQPEIGSDASSLTTTVQQIPDGFLINGKKRWIGNGNGGVLIVWARNKANKEVQGFIVETKDNGVKADVIKQKIPLRIVQNCQITFTNTKVPKDNKLPLAKNFQAGTAKILKHSRTFVCWMAAGVALGIYDNAIRYTSNRKQFNREISGFQLVQQKLVRLLSNTNAIFLSCFRISFLVDQKRATMGQIAMAKAYCTERLREVAKLGRQVMGGNGILMQNYAMKALVDAQALYTYQGTYEVNTLVTGRQITGGAAFK